MVAPKGHLAQILDPNYTQALQASPPALQFHVPMSFIQGIKDHYLCFVFQDERSPRKSGDRSQQISLCGGEEFLIPGVISVFNSLIAAFRGAGGQKNVPKSLHEKGNPSKNVVLSLNS